MVPYIDTMAPHSTHSGQVMVKYIFDQSTVEYRHVLSVQDVPHDLLQQGTTAATPRDSLQLQQPHAEPFLQHTSAHQMLVRSSQAQGGIQGFINATKMFQPLPYMIRRCNPMRSSHK